MSTEPTSPSGLDPALLEVLRCPACRERFTAPSATEIGCGSCGRVYPIRNGVPILLVDEASTPGPSGSASTAGASD